MKAELGGHTGAWVFQVWASFSIAAFATGIGIAYLPIDAWMRAFVGLGALFTVASSFSLSKTVRDNHEIARIESQNRVAPVAARPTAGAYRENGYPNAA